MNTDKYQAIMCYMGDVINIPHPVTNTIAKFQPNILYHIKF